MPSYEGIGEHSDNIIQAELNILHLSTLSFPKVVITPAIGVCVYADRQTDRQTDR